MQGWLLQNTPQPFISLNLEGPVEFTGFDGPISASHYHSRGGGGGGVRPKWESAQ